MTTKKSNFTRVKTIKKISANATYMVRHPVLRTEKPIESCQFEGDNLETTSHFGLYLNKKLTGVLSVFKNKNTIFNEEMQYQIRGMAIFAPFQRKGLGKELLNHAEDFIKQQSGTLIWFNARESAVGFYQNLGFEIVGAPFIIANVGLHYVMKKKLATSYD